MDRLNGKTIDRVMVDGTMRGDPQKPFDFGQESGGLDVTMYFTDGTRAVLRCCSCCGGLEIGYIDAQT